MTELSKRVGHVQTHLVANVRVLDNPVSLAKRLSTPADWPLWAVVLGHVPLAGLLATPLIVLVRAVAN